MSSAPSIQIAGMVMLPAPELTPSQSLDNLTAIYEGYLKQVPCDRATRNALERSLQVLQHLVVEDKRRKEEATRANLER